MWKVFFLLNVSSVSRCNLSCRSWISALCCSFWVLASCMLNKQTNKQTNKQKFLNQTRSFIFWLCGCEIFYSKTKLKSLATTGLRCTCGCHACTIRVLAERLLSRMRPQQPQWQSKHTSARRIMGNTRAGCTKTFSLWLRRYHSPSNNWKK